MQQLLNRKATLYILPLLSSILFWLSAEQQLIVLGLVSWIPITVLQLKYAKDFRKLSLVSLVFYFFVGLLVFRWSLDSISWYTNGNTGIAMLCYLLFLLLYMVSNYVFVVVFYFLVRKTKTIHAAIACLALTGLLFDLLASSIFTGLPWLFIAKAYAVIFNNYWLQWANIGGLPLVTFIFLFFTGYCASLFLGPKKTNYIYTAITIVIIYSWGMFQLSDRTTAEAKTISVHLMNEHSIPQERWDNNKVNQLVSNYFHLLGSETQKDVLWLWTESAVPWTYEKNDLFIDSVLQISRNKQWAHIIGINTATSKKNVVNNSAYFFHNDTILRYDKHYLLDMAEQPLFGWNLPFLQTDGFHAIAGNSATVFQYKGITIGTLICNEANITEAAYNSYRHGAKLLYTMSNDSWFYQSELLKQMHFLNARIRATETGRPMIINSNLGISGVINQNGEIVAQEQTFSPKVMSYTIEINNKETSYMIYRYKYLYICIIFTLLFLFNRKKSNIV